MFSRYASLALLFTPAFAKVYDIKVGNENGELKFEPEAIGAAVGDQVVFHFWPKNHSVVQTSFASPCGAKDGGVNTGFHPVALNSTDEKPTYTITVNDTQPFWATCSQAKDTAMSHCGSGMVFSVNCPFDGPNSFDNFKKSALAIGEQLKAGGSASSAAPAESAAASYTVPPVADPVVATATVTLESNTWTTTYSSYPGSAGPTPAALTGQVHKVIVGGPSGQVFSPNFIQAAPRDTVVFEMHSKNHSVTQSTFAAPCLKMENGFDTGLMPVADENQQFPTWNLTINDTMPIWAYCKQKTPASHCGAGMVFAINSVETSSRSFSAFQGLAKQVNGTAAGAAASSETSAAPNGASSLHLNAGAALFVVAAFASLL